MGPRDKTVPGIASFHFLYCLRVIKPVDSGLIALQYYLCLIGTPQPYSLVRVPTLHRIIQALPLRLFWSDINHQCVNLGIYCIKLTRHALVRINVRGNFDESQFTLCLHNSNIRRAARHNSGGSSIQSTLHTCDKDIVNVGVNLTSVIRPNAYDEL